MDKDQDETGRTGYDLARAALADAQRMARGRPQPTRDARRRKQVRESNLRRKGYTAPGPDPRDPQPLGAVLDALLTERAWKLPLAQARVFADWPALVGPEIAAHCEPTALVDGELRIAAQSTAWATQLRLLAGTLLARLVADLGPSVVTRLTISGPVAPSWRHGPRTVRGTRGPRDTYG